MKNNKVYLGSMQSHVDLFGPTTYSDKTSMTDPDS